MKANEFQLRDNTGRELAVYDMNTGRMKYYNLFGNGSLGRAEANWDSIWVEDPRSQNPGYWSYSRTDSRYYYIKDHLGSIRITIDEAGNVVNAQDYYSFGGILRSYETGGLSGERYKFTGKERDTETNYDYFGARYYDSDLGRWLTPDPLADKYPGWSPYNYVMNNPLRLIDPNGMGIKDSASAANQQESEQQLQKDKQELAESWDNGDVLGVVGNFFEVLWDGVKTQAPTFSMLPENWINSVVKSLGKQYGNTQTTIGARALDKKIGHALSGGYKSSFGGIAATTENAQVLTRNILGNPSRVASGKVTTDNYNATGQGIRLNNATQKFVGFLEASKASR